MTKLLIFIALFILAASSQLQAQMLIETKSGDKLIGFIRNSGGRDVKMELLNGKNIIIKKRYIGKISNIIVEITMKNKLELIGNIINKNDKHIEVYIDKFDSSDIGRKVKLPEKYETRIFDISDIDSIDPGSVENVGRNEYPDSDNKDDSFYMAGISIGYPGLGHLIFGYKSGLLAVKLTAHGFGGGLDIALVPLNMSHFQLDIGCSVGIFSHVESCSYVSPNVSINLFGFYFKYGESFTSSDATNFKGMLQIGFVYRFN